MPRPFLRPRLDVPRLLHPRVVAAATTGHDVNRDRHRSHPATSSGGVSDVAEARPTDEAAGVMGPRWGSTSGDVVLWSLVWVP
ncbi:MAG: hypothetical protein M3256_01525 [Actinomycetota bacterium]|nr:hypothetical protein [Actinomycetota bacterium]